MVNRDYINQITSQYRQKSESKKFLCLACHAKIRKTQKLDICEEDMILTQIMMIIKRQLIILIELLMMN